MCSPPSFLLIFVSPSFLFFFFFFNDTATTEIYTLSLHDALPRLSLARGPLALVHQRAARTRPAGVRGHRELRPAPRSEEHTSELQSHSELVCRLLLEKKKIENNTIL